MGAFDWKKEYELGIEEIDSQHRELFKRIDRLTISLYEGKSKDEMWRLLGYLKSYVQEHFQTEENLFMKTLYPDAMEHRRRHGEFMDYFVSLEYDIRMKGADRYLAIRVEKDIRNWWNDHELNYDRKYLPFIPGVKRD